MEIIPTPTNLSVGKARLLYLGEYCSVIKRDEATNPNCNREDPSIHTRSYTYNMILVTQNV